MGVVSVCCSSFLEELVVLAVDLDGLAEPLDAFAFLPLALLLDAFVRIVVDADAVLHVVSPRANVLVSIFEDHGALAVLLALVEITSVAASIFEREFTLALENTLFQVALVGLLLLSEVVHAIAVEKPIREVALVVAAVGPVIATFTMHLALVELAAEPDLAKFPRLLSEAILEVVDPLAL